MTKYYKVDSFRTQSFLVFHKKNQFGYTIDIAKAFYVFEEDLKDGEKVLQLEKNKKYTEEEVFSLIKEGLPLKKALFISENDLKKIGYVGEHISIEKNPYVGAM